MGRSLKKGPYVVERLLEKVARAESSGSREPIKTWARACTIVPEFIGKNFAIHNGRTFMKLYVTEDMVGHKLGEFAPTRTFKGHGGKSVQERQEVKGERPVAGGGSAERAGSTRVRLDPEPLTTCH